MFQPNKWQAAVLRTYGGGDYAYIVDGMEPDPKHNFEGEDPMEWEDYTAFDEWCECNLGDTLLLFLMREFNEVEDDEPLERLKTAIADLDGLLPVITLLG